MTDEHYATRTREIHGSDLLSTPINLSTWFPPIPFFNSPNFGHELEAYYNKRAECWKDLEKVRCCCCCRAAAAPWLTW